jgi:GTP-binding protein
MFIDQAIIYVKSGKGGDGAVHFRREKYIPRGGPDGGDGGRGGNVVFKVSPKLNTLYDFQHQHRYIAENGKPGGRSDRTGRSAEDLVILVPAGTILFDADSNDIVADLVSADQELVVCKGGRGGRGNARFANSRDQAPRIAEKGEPGQERNLRLELKLIADVGIIGVPNAGKSTFLASVSNARPKIADYPFTTLEPNLGVSRISEDQSLILADIPGLIEGAHSGAGLGYDFLRHIQRTRVLIHLLNGLSENPVLDYAQTNSELTLFDPNLARKPQIVAVNKMDIPEVQDRWDLIERELKKKGIKAIPISAAVGTNVKKVLFNAAELLETTPEPTKEALIPIYHAQDDPSQFEIVRESKGWRISGVSIERAAAMTYWEYDDSVRRFQRILKTLGIDEALRNAGVKEGDTVMIGDYELEWKD